MPGRGPAIQEGQGTDRHYRCECRKAGASHDGKGQPSRGIMDPGKGAWQDRDGQNSKRKAADAAVYDDGIGRGLPVTRAPPKIPDAGSIGPHGGGKRLAEELTDKNEAK